MSAYIALLLFVLIKFILLDIGRVTSEDMRATFEKAEPFLYLRNFYSLQNGDVVYFRYPLTDSASIKTMIVQRVMALPGDTILIKDKEVLVNGVNFPQSPSLQFNYFIKTSCKLDSLYKLQLGLLEGGEVSDELDYSYSLTDTQYNALRVSPDVVNIERRTEKPGNYDENCFPFKSTYAWNNYHYGKLYVPKRNDTLALDTANIALYQLLITEHEKNKLEIKADSIFINDDYSKTYVVKKNYYFVMGDNRANANDSRNWGFLPENMIKGKIILSLQFN